MVSIFTIGYGAAYKAAVSKEMVPRKPVCLLVVLASCEGIKSKKHSLFEQE